METRMDSAPDNAAQMVVASRLRSEEHRGHFLELSRRMQAWLQQQPGFLRYELFETETGWLDTMLWKDRASMDSGNAAFGATELVAAFAEIVEPVYHSHKGTVTPLS
jgi:quinol monooxygenase YgiN